MSAINTSKVVAGGLIAGVVLNVMDFVGNLLMATDFAANSSRLGLDAAVMESPNVIVTWVLVDLIMGVLLVFTYAAMRPRFGAGVKTALYAGATLWFAVSMVLFGFNTMGMIDTALYWKSTVIALVNVGVATSVGAWIYKEG